MKQRVLTAFILIIFLIPILLFSNTFIFPIAVAAFCVIAEVEMLGCIGQKKCLSVSVPSVIYAFLVPFSVRIIIKYFDKNSLFIAIFAVLTFIYLFYLMCLAVVSKGTKPITDMALTIMTTLYITAGFSSIILLKDFSYNEQNHGKYLYLLVFLGAWLPDVAGYFCGMLFGKHKLIPDVSPKKTVEGAIGGVIFGSLGFVIFGTIINALGLAKPQYIFLAITGLLISVISIFGDLIASLIKRHYNIKDYGNLFPGHGGVLDRFDSIIAIAPFLLIICSMPDIFAIFI